MKSFLLALTFALAGSVGFVSLAKAAGPACVPPDAALFNAQAAAQDARGVAIRLSGDQAEDFLDYINDDVGPAYRLLGKRGHRRALSRAWL